MDIFLIDGIGPFFKQYKKRRINWSKIPFHMLSDDVETCTKQFSEIAQDTEIFTQRVRAVGYNSISFDDVAHLATDPWLEPEVNQRIELLRIQYQQLFSICQCSQLDVYLTMDVLSLTERLKARIGNNKELAVQFLERQVISVLDCFPNLAGIILRIGECDGTDVRGVFNSELLIETPGQANKLIHRLLKIFEARRKYLILRTWTVGAYPVGDLIWHRRTSARVLKNIDSDYFILSMKYGESDFFRYLPLNKLFFQLDIKKIVELQAKREYEGCGEYPSFIGWDYEEYAQQLDGAKNVVGISVWCQTGGWVPFRRLSYLEPAGIWNELNAYLCIKLFKDRQSVAQAVTGFAGLIGGVDAQKLLRLLELNDQVIKELLYIQELAEQKYFFRRVRIPPLISVMWNNIFINDSVRTLLRAFIDDGEPCIARGYAALAKIKEMERLAAQMNLPVEDFRFMHDTFSILALARDYYFRPYREDIRQEIKAQKRRYKKRYPKRLRPRYRVKTNFTPFVLKRRHLKWLMNVALRKKRGYRVLDHLVTINFLGYFYRFLVRLKPKIIPKFARKQAMGIETIFK
ncbi:MAG: hypothetical protein D6B25_10155 [Desulfobulbaceae bacterium]|nr:MAG: hypothetical protein D6B25_10155 [Desulfobulbaceae bacterium]